MGIWDGVRGLFSRRQRLADLTVDELTKSRAQLEREQARVLRKIDEIEAQKADLDAKGRAERSARKQRLLAQQLLQLEAQAKHEDRYLSYYAKQMRVVDGFVFLKQNQKLWANSPIGNIIANMDTAELQTFVDQASLDGNFQLEKLNQLLGVFREDEELFKPDEEEEGVTAIMRAWQQDQEAEAALPDLFDVEEGERE